jgi:hypothetical protein
MEWTSAGQRQLSAAHALHTEARVHLGNNNVDRGLAMLSEALQVRTKVLPDTHPLVLLTMEDISYAMSDHQGATPELHDMLEDIIERQQARLGTHHVDVETTAERLVRCCVDLNDSAGVRQWTDFVWKCRCSYAATDPNRPSFDTSGIDKLLGTLSKATLSSSFDSDSEVLAKPTQSEIKVQPLTSKYLDDDFLNATCRENLNKEKATYERQREELAQRRRDFEEAAARSSDTESTASSDSSVAVPL